MPERLDCYGRSGSGCKQLRLIPILLNVIELVGENRDRNTAWKGFADTVTLPVPALHTLTDRHPRAVRPLLLLLRYRHSLNLSCQPYITDHILR